MQMKTNLECNYNAIKTKMHIGIFEKDNNCDPALNNIDVVFTLKRFSLQQQVTHWTKHEVEKLKCYFLVKCALIIFVLFTT